IGIVLAATGVLLAGMVWEFGSTVASQADQLMSKLSDALTAFEQYSQRYANLHRLFTLSNVNLEGPTVSLLSATVSMTAAVVLVLFVAAYTSVNPSPYINGFLRFFSPRRRKQVSTILGDVDTALKWWLLGQLIAMSVVGVITAVGLLIVGVPLALPL